VSDEARRELCATKSAALAGPPSSVLRVNNRVWRPVRKNGYPQVRQPDAIVKDRLKALFPPPARLFVEKMGNIRVTAKLDPAATFIAAYLSWARERRVVGTAMPVICYRGHADSNWTLLPTICRLKAPADFIKQCETDVLREFRGRFGLTDWTDIDVLAYARHHGAPTRLLDWSRNPLVGLWFAVGEPAHDNKDGAVYQLSVLGEPKAVCLATGFKLESAEKCACGKPVHLFASPSRIERGDRQRSAFTITSFKDGAALAPLDSIEPLGERSALRAFPVGAKWKILLRSALSDLGLDAFSIYGDPDSFGKAITVSFTTALSVASFNKPKVDLMSSEKGCSNSP
jgi:hypothetical protein